MMSNSPRKAFHLPVAAFLGLPLIWVSPAQAVSVQVTPSTTSATLGQPVPFLAQADLPAGATLDLDLQHSATDVFAIQHIAKADESPGTSGLRLRFDILPLALGKLPVNLAFRVTQDGTTSIIQADPITLDIAPPPGVTKASEIRDIKGPLRARWPLWLWLILGALLAGLIYAWRRKMRGRDGFTTRAAQGPPRSPEELAREALETLRASGLWQEGRRREFYFELTEILRLYLENRAHIPATRLTTTELLRNLRQAELDKEVCGAVRKIMDRADLVKFAKLAPAGGWGEEDIAAALSIVASLEPPPPAPPEPKEQAAGKTS
jgi:hypothetical protein